MRTPPHEVAKIASSKLLPNLMLPKPIRAAGNGDLVPFRSFKVPRIIPSPAELLSLPRGEVKRPVPMST